MSAPVSELLAVVELGGYPDFRSVYERAGFRVQTVISVRKALSEIKKSVPSVVVAEFNFQSDFRDRTSSLESLLAVVSRHSCKVVVFYDREFTHQLAKLQARFAIHATLAYPIVEAELSAAVGVPGQ